MRNGQRQPNHSARDQKWHRLEVNNPFNEINANQPQQSVTEEQNAPEHPGEQGRSNGPHDQPPSGLEQMFVQQPASAPMFQTDRNKGRCDQIDDDQRRSWVPGIQEVLNLGKPQAGPDGQHRHSQRHPQRRQGRTANRVGPRQRQKHHEKAKYRDEQEHQQARIVDHIGQNLGQPPRGQTTCGPDGCHHQAGPAPIVCLLHHGLLDMCG